MNASSTIGSWVSVKLGDDSKNSAWIEKANRDSKVYPWYNVQPPELLHGRMELAVDIEANDRQPPINEFFEQDAPQIALAGSGTPEDSDVSGRGLVVESELELPSHENPAEEIASRR